MPFCELTHVKVDVFKFGRIHSSPRQHPQDGDASFYRNSLTTCCTSCWI